MMINVDLIRDLLLFLVGVMSGVAASMLYAIVRRFK